MDDRVENGSRRIFPYLIYAVYTVYMAVMAVGLSWPSWVTAVALCILAAGIGLRILLGRQSYLAAIFCGVGIWVNVILYSVYTDSVLDVLGSVAAVVVLLSLFDVIEIHYISMAATILFVILNIFVLHKVEFSGALSVLECIMQFLAIFILELMEIKLLKDRIKKSRELMVFTAFLVVALWKFDVVLDVLKAMWKIIFPFVLGGAIAFVTNVPMSFLEKKIFKKQNKAAEKLARPVSLLLTIVLVIGVIAVVMFGVIPQLTRTMGTLMMSIADFVPEMQRWIREFSHNNQEIMKLVNQLQFNSDQAIKWGVPFLKK